MITTDQIASFRKPETEDFRATEKLKADFAQLRRERQPFYLTAGEMERILEWKLGQQIGRQRHLRAANTDDLIRAVTGLALTVTHADKDYECELRFDILCVLRGIGIPVASAILALIFPEEYAVIDFRVWEQVFGESRTAFAISDYHKYMHEMRRLARELGGWQPQEVDHAIWEYSKQRQQS